jgi:uncharacterized protein YfeS
MRIIAISRTYDRRGAAPITNVARYLRPFLASVRPADLMIEIESFHLSTGETRPSLGPLRDRFEDQYERLPRLRYVRKANKVTFEYPSKLPSDVALALGKTHPQTFRAVVSELRSVVETAFSSSRSLLKVIDVAGLRNGLAQASDQLPHRDEAIERLIDEIDAEWEAERLRPMTMDRLTVEWSQFHPNARALLNDPFFWNPVDDDAPHGNDTGADLLAAFRRWRTRNRATNPLNFLDSLLKRWEPSSLTADNPTILEAKIGLAFAQIKLEGTCHPAVAARAIAAIDQRLSDVANDTARVSKFRLLRERVLLLANHGAPE